MSVGVRARDRGVCWNVCFKAAVLKKSEDSLFFELLGRSKSEFRLHWKREYSGTKWEPKKALNGNQKHNENSLKKVTAKSKATHCIITFTPMSTLFVTILGTVMYDA